MCSQILNGFYLRILKIRKWGAQTIYPSYGHKQTTLRVKKITGNLISRMTLVFYKQHAIWLHSSVVEVSVSKSWWFESRSCEHKFQCFEVLSFSWHMTGFILYILTDVKSAKFNSNECFLAAGCQYQKMYALPHISTNKHVRSILSAVPICRTKKGFQSKYISLGFYSISIIEIFRLLA